MRVKESSDKQTAALCLVAVGRRQMEVASRSRDSHPASQSRLIPGQRRREHSELMPTRKRQKKFPDPFFLLLIHSPLPEERFSHSSKKNLLGKQKVLFDIFTT